MYPEDGKFRKPLTLHNNQMKASFREFWLQRIHCHMYSNNILQSIGKTDMIKMFFHFKN